MLQAKDTQITASIRPLQSIIANILDGCKEVELIADKNESIHHYQLKPTKVILISQSDIIVIIDKNFETFLDKPLSRYGKNKMIIEVSKLPGVSLIKNTEGLDHHHDHEDGHVHLGEYDYHIWLDVANVKAIAKELTKIFIAKLPEKKEILETNLKTFIQKLSALDAKIKAKTLLARNKKFIVTHNAYEYFIKRYGLSQPLALSIDHDHNIGARDMLSIKKTINDGHVKCIFEEPQFNSQIIHKIQQNSKVKVDKLDAEWGKDDIPEKDVYFSIMNSLAENFARCLE